MDKRTEKFLSQRRNRLSRSFHIGETDLIIQGPHVVQITKTKQADGEKIQHRCPGLADIQPVDAE